jgi:hypothetical protein
MVQFRFRNAAWWIVGWVPAVLLATAVWGVVGYVVAMGAFSVATAIALWRCRV